MRYVGESFACESSCPVSDAVVTPKKISVDWEEKGGRAHLEATSTDHVNFEGHYGYPHPEENRLVRFKKYRAANGEVVLLGTWYNQAKGNEGTWVLRLEPA